MPKQFDDMVSAIKKSLRKRYPKMKDDEISSRAYAIATASWKKSHGGKAPSREEFKDWRVLEFYVPIEEKVFDEKTDDFIIRGVAINETTTLNNVKYVADELQKAASSFRNVPILLDHKNEVRNIVGRTTEKVDFNPQFRRIEFEGKIMDKEIREMIRDGRIGSVSIGAKVQDLLEEEDGSMKATGIHGLEISLVAVPGDSQATLAQAFQHSFMLKEKAKLQDELNVEEILMTEEETKIEDTESPEEVPEEKPEEVAEEKVQNINVKVDTTEISDMKKQITELKELLMEKKKVKEQAEEEKEDETKGEVSAETEEKLNEIDNLIFERAESGKGFALYRNYSKEDLDTTNLKRLVR